MTRKTNNLYEINFPKYEINPLNDPKPIKSKVLGFDTETALNGKITLIASSNKRYATGTDPDIYLKFLSRPAFEKTINFFFNLEFDTNAILTRLPKKVLKQIATYNQAWYKRYKIKIIPKKCLEITADPIQAVQDQIKYELMKEGYEGKELLKEVHDRIVEKRYVVQYFDIAQFYQLGNLEKTYSKVFNKPYKKIYDASKGVSIKNVNKHTIKYCVEDAIICQKLAEHFHKTVNKIVPLKKYYSNASLGKQLLRLHMTEPFRPKRNKLNEFALRSYFGGRIEVIQRGFFETAYNYDINSAYPSIQSELYKIQHNYTYKPVYEPDSLHSFYLVNMKIPDCIVSPIPYDNKGLICFPKGRFKEIYLSKVELELLMDYDFPFQIKKAVHDHGDKEYEYGYMKDLYKERLKLKKAKDPRQLPLKLALNSSYGILIERRHGFKDLDIDFQDKEYLDLYEDPNNTIIEGKDGYDKLRMDVKQYNAGYFFNPCHASEITAGIRCKLYRDSIDHEENVIKYSTDAISFDKKVKLPFSDKLGEYGDSIEYKGFVVGNGVYALHSDDPNKRVIKFRSFDNTTDIFKIAKENPDLDHFRQWKKRPIKLKEAKNKDFKGFNRFVWKNKDMDINFDTKRKWNIKQIPKNFGDMLKGQITSKPITI